MLCYSLALLSLFTIASCDVFYIVTSPSSPCPGEFTGIPCLTFDQYASNPSQSANITLLVEPGNYTLSTVLSVSNGYNFTMSSKNATVMCTSSAAKFTFNAIQNVYVSGMCFQGCRSSAIMLTSVSNAIISSSKFINNRRQSGSGGGLYVTSSILTITDSEFQNNYAYYGGAIYAYANSATSAVSIRRTNFSENSAYRYGGAIRVEQYYIYRQLFEFPTLIVEECTFGDNYVTRSSGGSVYVSGLTIFRDTIFSGNLVRYRGSGGAVYAGDNATFTDCHFRNNIAYGNQGSGGAVYTTGNDVSFFGCNFTNNTAMANGGAIYRQGQNDITHVVGTVFDHNIANSYGGSIYVSGTNNSVAVSHTSFLRNRAIQEGGGAIYINSRYANVTMISSVFRNNSASYCGVLDVDNLNHFRVDLTNSVFTHNTATGQTIGGGVACIRNASINIINSSFKHNSANYHAGVFYIDESVTTVDGSLFINNSAALDGGVFYTYVHASEYFIRRSQFSENTAEDDGGVIFIGRLNSHVSIDESIFDFNSAGNRGGVVALVASSMFMEINGSNIYNNTAQFGGVISACNSHVTLLDDTLYVTVDPVYSFCTLYEGNVRHYNITTPQDPMVTMTTNALPPTTPPTTSPPPTTSLPTTVASTTPTSHFETSVPTTNSPSISATQYRHTTAQPRSTTDTPSTTIVSTTMSVEIPTEITPSEIHPTINDNVTQSITQTEHGTNPPVTKSGVTTEGSVLPNVTADDDTSVNPITTVNDLTKTAASTTLSDKSSSTIKPEDGTNTETPTTWNISTILSVVSLGVSLCCAIIVIVALSLTVILCSRKKTKKSNLKEEVSTHLSKYSVLKNEEDQEL